MFSIRVCNWTMVGFHSQLFALINLFKLCFRKMSCQNIFQNLEVSVLFYLNNTLGYQCKEKIHPSTKRFEKKIKNEESADCENFSKQNKICAGFKVAKKILGGLYLGFRVRNF